MKKGNNEFLGLLCNLYITALLVALPLYTGKGYEELGDTKYMLFRNVSLLCLGVWLLAGTPGRVRSMREYLRILRAGRRKNRVFMRKAWMPFDVLDCAVAAYALCVLASTFCSSYKDLAWNGYEGWYMGAVSQLLFAGIYFFVSRQYDGAVWPLYLGEGALFLVTVLGLLHRLGIDPLGLMAGWSTKSWVYSHMLSTLGNINWLCGYYSVVLAFVTVHYLRETTLWIEILLYIVTVTAFVLLAVQGSQGGLLILAVCVACCVLVGRGQAAVPGRVCLLLMGFFLCMPLMGWLMELRGNKAAVVADGNIFGSTKWYGWLTAAGVCAVLLFLIKRRRLSGGTADGEETGGDKKGLRSRENREESGSGEGRRRAGRISMPLKAALFGTLLTAALLAGILFLRGVDDGFGSGRGLLWRISVESFKQADIKDKLLGAGPDCYAEAVFNPLAAGTDVWKGEHWDGAVFTNAHNEWLSQLCNTGLLGAAGYLAIFLVGFWKCRRDREASSDVFRISWIGFMALAMYGAHSLISFQQVLNAPFLFLVLGLCRAYQGRTAENQGGGEQDKGIQRRGVQDSMAQGGGMQSRGMHGREAQGRRAQGSGMQSREVQGRRAQDSGAQSRGM